MSNTHRSEIFERLRSTNRRYDTSVTFCKMVICVTVPGLSHSIDQVLAVLQIDFLSSVPRCPKELVQKFADSERIWPLLQLTFLLLGVGVDGFQQTKATILDGLMAILQAHNCALELQFLKLIIVVFRKETLA